MINTRRFGPRIAVAEIDQRQDRPLRGIRKRSYEKGNVDQRLATRGMPGRDC